MSRRRGRIVSAIEALHPHAVPIIVVGSCLVALLASCESSAAQTTTYREGPGLVLDFALTERGWSDTERDRVKSAVAVRANTGAVGAGSRWLGAAAKAARAAGALGVAVTAYEAYDLVFGSDPETAMPERQDFDVPVNFPVDQSWSTSDFGTGISTTVDGWLNDYLTCPGFGNIASCVQDAIYKDIHGQMQRGTEILRGNEFSDNWEADPGSMKIVSVEITSASQNYSGQARPSQIAGPVQFNYTAVVDIPFYNSTTNELMGTSRVNYTGRVSVTPTLVRRDGTETTKDPVCVRFPNQFPVNGQIHLCGIGPLTSPASNVPVRFDEMTDQNLVPSWTRFQQPNPALIAELFNSWGRDLHTIPGFEDLRWREITPRDIQNAPRMPGLHDWNTPIRNPSTGTYPWAPTQPSSPPGTGPAPVPPPGPNPNPDPPPSPGPGPGPGPNPNPDPPTEPPPPEVPDPDLAHPTIAQILDPVFAAFPALQEVQITGPQGSCPVAQFDAFERAYRVDSHCGIIEDNRSLITTIAMLCFTILALFVVLAA